MIVTRYVPLGDQAALVYLPDEQAALRFARVVRRAAPPWLVDIVQAYTSVAVYYDLERIAFDQVETALAALAQDIEQEPALEVRRHRIPCCYEFGLDLQRIAEHTKLSVDEVIRRHSSAEYTVYAIGFCPGFPYLGYLPAELSGVPRLLTPRLRVEPGSVGLTGRQTGIYTEPRPGGWNIVGRTPLELVNVADGYFPLRTGDRVSFAPVSESEYRSLLGQRL